MKALLARFGVAMDALLLQQLDQLVKNSKATRSKVLCDLVRAEVMHAKLAPNSPAILVLTLVYDHHDPGLEAQLTDIQHDFQTLIISTQHVHLDHHHCLEIVAVRGRAREIEKLACSIKSLVGVKQVSVSLANAGR
jgi:CopG family nickel-responsive transcriptional regulator